MTLDVALLVVDRQHSFGLYRRLEEAGNCHLLLDNRVLIGPDFHIALFTFAVLLLSAYLIFSPAIYPLSQAEDWWGRLLFGCSLLLMVLTATSDPGVIMSPERSSLSASSTVRPARTVSYRGVRLQQKYCAPCDFYRPLRSSHCRETNLHIAKFDHMCAFLGTAIGAQNYRWFLGAIVAVTAYSLLGVRVFGQRVAGCLAVDCPFAEAVGWTTMTIVSIVSFFAFAVLVGYHSYITAHNITMNEQIKKVFEGETRSPFSREHWWDNVLDVLLVRNAVPPIDELSADQA